MNRVMTSGERTARWRAKRRAAGQSGHTLTERMHKRDKGSVRPFMGADGEGAGTDDLSRQLYLLLRVGDRELCTGQPLATDECLNHICESPRAPLLVGFSFGYDVTMILRDLPSDRRERLLGPRPDIGEGISPYTYYSDYAIDYLPRNHLRVARTERTAGGKRRVVPGSARTIYDVFAFFQCSFLKALEIWNIGTVDQRRRIKHNKEKRSDFVEMDAEVKLYCDLECSLLADLMEQFRRACHDADIRPRTWNGAGKLAAALHGDHETMLRRDYDTIIPHGARVAASQAYYGGRFEVTRTGAIAGPIYEYDLKSAYPAAMRTLPCLVHGQWRETSVKELSRLSTDNLFVAPVGFDHPGPTNLCGLPVRKKDGRLHWPVMASGVYWSVEIAAASRLGCEVKYTASGWRYEKRCDCHAFEWVEKLYEYRRSIGSSGKGLVIKLGLNALYGLLAQRIGAARWANAIWAGLITATTRAALAQAAAHDPDAILMLATDGVFSARPLPLEIGESLGQWETAVHDDLFIVQPGVYWRPAKVKSRGTSIGMLQAKIPEFETAWSRYREEDRAAVGIAFPPAVKVPVNLFTGIKIAQARGKPDTAGRWVSSPEDCRHDTAACHCRTISFAWGAKRGQHRWDGDAAWTYPLPGGRDLVSMPHKFDLAVLEAMDLDRQELEEQPDYTPLLPE